MIGSTKLEYAILQLRVLRRRATVANKRMHNATLAVARQESKIAFLSAEHAATSKSIGIMPPSGDWNSVDNFVREKGHRFNGFDDGFGKQNGHLVQVAS